MFWEIVYSKVVKHGKNAWKFMFLLKIHDTFIFTAPARMFFITFLPVHLNINLVSPNNNFETIWTKIAYPGDEED